MEKKIDLEEIIDSVTFKSNSDFYGEDKECVKQCMLKAIKQTLELAAENSKVEIKNIGEELVITDIYQKDTYTRIQVNIPSILNTINQIK